MRYLRVLPSHYCRFTVVVVRGLMETLNIDFMCPFPQDNYSNMLVLATMTDSFTRVVGLYAVRDANAKETARMLIRRIGIFGYMSRQDSIR
jgi:hypothetical protein